MKNGIAAFLLILAAVAALIFLWIRASTLSSKEVVEKTWEGYKRYFIAENGRVMRPEEDDTVSEGQAYAMLRAVWMNDKRIFDECYLWSEENLSRKTEKGDHLLAWHWKQGGIVDWMPASDADIDYALSLVFASRLWPQSAPAEAEDYGRKAKNVLSDILRLETIRMNDGRLYLLPWLLGNKPQAPPEFIPLNPSYYSPAHFRVFYEVTKDSRWLELAQTTYDLLNELSRQWWDPAHPSGLIPDWCRLGQDGKFSALEGKSNLFGWDAVRVPLRLAMDEHWFGNGKAKTFFRQAFSEFIENEWGKNSMLFCEYTLDGKPAAAYENPLFYAAYYCALKLTGSPLAALLKEKNRSYLEKDGPCWIYGRQGEYYTNSLAWFGDGFDSGRIRLIRENARDS